VKLVVVILYIVVLTSLPVEAHFTWPLVFWGLIVIAIGMAHLPMWTILKRSAVALPFALAALALVFTTPGQPWLGVSLGPVSLSITDAGVYRFMTVLVKSWLGVQAALLLSASTPFVDLLCGLRRLGVPPLLVSMTSFMYRYLFVLVDEVRRMMCARDARSARPDGRVGGSVAWRAKVTGQMAGSLFLRSYERSERIYMAMLARGFDGEMRPPRRSAPQRNDVLFAGASLIVLAFVLLWYTVLPSRLF